MVNLKDNDIRNDLIDAHLSPYRDALTQIGIGPLTVARKRKQQLKAKSVKHIKVKGDIPLCTKLAPGYRVIGAGGVTESEHGNIVFDDTLIEFRGIDWGIQEKATAALEKIFDIPQKQIVEHTGSIGMTYFPPEPQSMDEWEEMYEKMKAGKHDPNDPNRSTGV